MAKIKTYVLPISKQFPASHERNGEPTYFPEKILNEQISCGLIDKKTLDRFAESGYDFNNKVFYASESKIHTIRVNYKLWAKRIEKVLKGEAVLSLRFWADKPYHRDENGIGQVEICILDKDSGIGIQKVNFDESEVLKPFIEHVFVNRSEIAKNDGLSLKDFKEWFKDYDLSKPLAIIHFTDFRY